MAIFEIVAGLLLVAFGAARDMLSGGPPSIGLRQFMIIVAGFALVADGVTRLRTRLRIGLLQELGEPGAAGDRSMVVIAALLLLLNLFAFQHYVVDDAYITFRYAKNALESGHLVWNLGERPVEGYSNFLWMLVAMVAMKANLDPLMVSKFLSGVALVGSLFVVRRLARAAGAMPLGERLAVLVLAGTPAFAFWAMSGLETISVVLFSLLFLLALDDDLRCERTPWLSALWAALLVLSRPEAPMFLVLAVLPVLWRGRAESIRRIGLLVALVALATLPYFIWKLRAFGTLMPNTLSAKARPMSGLKLVVEAYGFVFPFLLPGLLVLVRAGNRLHRQFWVLFAGYSLAALNVAPHVAHYLRFYLPVMGGVAVVAGAGLEHLARSVSDAVLRRRVLTGLCLATFAFLLAPIFGMRTYAENEARGYQHAHIPVGRLLAAAYDSRSVLAASDCGLVPFESGMRTIDIWGLTDRRIATRGFDRQYVMAQHPDVVVIHSLYPGEFRGREAYDEGMFEAVQQDPELRLRGRWGFFGYWLWVYSRRPLPLGLPADAPPPIFN